MNGRIELLDEPGLTATLEAPEVTQSLPAVRQATKVATAPRSRDDMLMMAMDRGYSPEQIAQFMDLRDRHEAREAEKAYNVAFSAFKAEAVRIIKNRTVTDGPLKGKKYAELFAVVNAATPALSLHGLSAAWSITKDEPQWIEVTCTIKHVDGHAESVSMGGPPDTGGAKNAVMARASTVSYLERYTFKAITGLSEQEDDNDGAGAAGRDDAMLQGFRDAAMNGTAALRAHYEKAKPGDAWWGKHSKSLKDAAKLSDAGEQQ